MKNDNAVTSVSTAPLHLFFQQVTLRGHLTEFLILKQKIWTPLLISQIPLSVLREKSLWESAVNGGGRVPLIAVSLVWPGDPRQVRLSGGFKKAGQECRCCCKADKKKGFLIVSCGSDAAEAAVLSEVKALSHERRKMEWHWRIWWAERIFLLCSQAAREGVWSNTDTKQCTVAYHLAVMCVCYLLHRQKAWNSYDKLTGD